MTATTNNETYRSIAAERDALRERVRLLEAALREAAERLTDCFQDAELNNGKLLRVSKLKAEETATRLRALLPPTD